MRKALLPILLSIISLYIYSCATQGSPTGGPKDTIPPILLESNPEHKSINFKGKEFHFSFSERIDASKLKQKLIITPFIENNYKFRSKKDELFIEFEEDFEDSTTYTFNFSDGVVDLTEKNPVENFTLAFSTGPYIDSISVEGHIYNQYTNKKIEKATVALYAVKDTLNILTGKPRYFTKTDTSGYYRIENIKTGYYFIYAFEDANNNLKCEPDTEPHGFIKDSINLYSHLSEQDILIQLLNVNTFKKIRSKQTGSYFDILYNKFIKEYTLTKLDTTQNLPIPQNNKIKENTIIRMYHDSSYRYDQDSLGIILTAKDTVYNQIRDTVYVKFTESKRKPEKLNYSVNPKDKASVDQTFDISLYFTKPITAFYKDSITRRYDTLIAQHMPDSLFTWNTNHTQLTIHETLDKRYFQTHVDSLLLTIIDSTLDATDSLSMDSLSMDTLKMQQRKYLERLNTDHLTYIFPKGTFISLESDTVDQLDRTYSFKNPENYGKVSGEVITDHTHYILQLVNKDHKVFAQLHNPKKFTFTYVKPGNYSLRVLIDINKDGIWSHGNLSLQVAPEPIYFYTDRFDIRANWEIENIQVMF
ncbi:hypothetical protein BFP72_17150 [Reichenbachiella sp. 5M10]|uniref:Ig-like domain-containing domain n=1 Tax=Reichenbachiella sp. 5M10 TaxID=1889772 RepID=UPI000C15FA6C|nr:Ig-like domain-containing domain [Reichenbachiella sp. 5M10]PIB37006.1 hypothetical protein BFP72_17150 [Reichenbachiella sp. 5M10]